MDSDTSSRRRNRSHSVLYCTPESLRSNSCIGRARERESAPNHVTANQRAIIGPNFFPGAAHLVKNAISVGEARQTLAAVPAALQNYFLCRSIGEFVKRLMNRAGGC